VAKLCRTAVLWRVGGGEHWAKARQRYDKRVVVWTPRREAPLDKVAAQKDRAITRRYSRWPCSPSPRRTPA
jgi:hypothetical protein